MIAHSLVGPSSVLSETRGRVFCLLAVALTAVGCGGMPATLSGKVTLDGSPVQADGEVSGSVFVQAKGMGGAPATGKIAADGSYQVTTGTEKGLAPGDYLVSVSLVRTIPSEREGYPPWAEKLISPKYSSSKTSGLSVTVKPGSNEYDIALESGGMAKR